MLHTPTRPWDMVIPTVTYKSQQTIFPNKEENTAANNLVAMVTMEHKQSKPTV
jgi:hypothetical protein